MHSRLDSVAAGAKGALALRPEQVSIGQQLQPGPDQNHFAGKVFDFLYLGDVTVYVVELPNGSGSRRCCPTPRPAAPSSSSRRRRGDQLALSTPAAF